MPDFCCCLVHKLYLFCDLRDCSPPVSSVHGLSQARMLEVGCNFLIQGIFLTQELNPCLLHWQADSLLLSHLGSLYLTLANRKSP